MNTKIILSFFGVASEVKNQSLPLGNFHGDYCYNRLLSDEVVTGYLCRQNPPVRLPAKILDFLQILTGLHGH